MICVTYSHYMAYIMFESDTWMCSSWNTIPFWFVMFCILWRDIEVLEITFLYRIFDTKRLIILKSYLALLFLLGVLDFFFVNLAYHSTIAKGASVQLVFGFEVSITIYFVTCFLMFWNYCILMIAYLFYFQYAILLSVVVNIFLKYALHSYDLQSENPWENKAVFLLYSELVMGMLIILFKWALFCFKWH